MSQGLCTTKGQPPFCRPMLVAGQNFEMNTPTHLGARWKKNRHGSHCCGCAKAVDLVVGLFEPDQGLCSDVHPVTEQV